jgi:S-methylmethionine-dependent homocysteine/selenocysteine methylase
MHILNGPFLAAGYERLLTGQPFRKAAKVLAGLLGRPARLGGKTERGPGMSVAEELAGRLADGEVVIIDGGTGTQLQAVGVPMDDDTWSGRANLEQREVVQRVHEAYIRAGAEVIITNTFAASRAALEPAGLGGRVADANRNAVVAALRAREAAADGRAVAVAGSMSPFCPIVMRGRNEAGPAAADCFPSLADFREQAGLLAEAGVDLIALELMEAPGYGHAALQAATETGLPVWLGFSAVRLDDGSLGADPALGEGDSFAELVRKLADPGLAAVTVMHAKPDVSLEAIDIIRAQFAGPIGVYAESGSWTAPEWVFDELPPSQYLQEAIAWTERGAQLIGGCCGIGPEHIKILADHLPRRTR